MLLFMDGFDQMRDMIPADLLPALNGSGYVATGTIVVDSARDTAQRALRLGDGANTPGTLKRTFASSQQRVVIGFAYKADLLRNDIAVVTSVGTIAWNTTTGKISFAGGTGTATVLLGLWYYFEIVVDKEAGLVQLWINNGKDIEAALPGSAQFLTTYELTVAGVAQDKKYIDDLYALDSSAGRYTARIGPIAILSRLPTSDVVKEWSPSTGNDHYALVDNTPPKAAEYIQSNTSGALDSFLSDNGIPAGSAILAVGLTAFNRKSDIDGRQLGLAIGPKTGARKEVVDTTLSVTSKYSYAVFESAPDNSAWTDELATSTPFGVVVRP